MLDSNSIRPCATVCRKAEEHGHINRILRSKDKAEPCRVSPSAPIKPIHHPMCGFYFFVLIFERLELDSSMCDGIPTDSNVCKL